MPRTVAILTATSASGDACIDKLVKEGGDVTVRACVRSQEKADQVKAKYPDVEIAICDATDEASLKAALNGVDAAMVVTPMDLSAGFAKDADKSIAMIRAAQEAGATQVVHVGSFTAGLKDKVPTLASRFYPTEQYLKEEVGDSMHWTVLRGGSFVQNIFGWAREFKANGKLHNVNGYLSPVDVRDIGRCAAAIFLHPDDAEAHHGKFYEMTGPEEYDTKELVAILSEATGVEIPLELRTLDEMKAAGTHPFYLEVLSAAIERALPFVPKQIEDITGEPANTLANWAAENASAFK